MALDINGYNAAFKAFTDFAQQKMDAGETKAVARGEVQNKVFDGRVIKAATTDEAYAFTRSADEKYFNEVAREQFKRAIIDMFGGESNIPESVRKAMLLGDYGSGKPLTARRIMAVKNAIDADGTARARSADARQREFDASISKFSSPEVEAAALAKGYSKAELPRLAAAANLYAKAVHCSEADALAEVATPGSKANRLMNYGGRFLKSAKNFENGLRLLDAYSTWFDKTEADLKELGISDNYVEGMSKTLLNASAGRLNAQDKRGIEKFVFEELAYNSSVNLAEPDSEKVFGMENNAAMRFIGRGFHAAKSQTLGQIPPERRPAFFAAFDLLTPLFASTVHEAKIRPALRHEIKGCDTGYLMGRILKNFDKIEGLLKQGQLDMKGLVKLCFPEIKKVGDDPVGAVNKLFTQWLKDTSDDPMTGAPSRIPSQYYGQIMMMQEVTGCGLDDAYEAVLGHKQIPLVPYASNGTLGIDSFDGTPTAARKQLAADLDRPVNYSIVGGQADILPADCGFGFNFPGENRFITNYANKDNIKTVCDKVEAFCGKTHPAQASSVMMMMSQSGLAPLRNGLLPFGVASNEHSACDFTLSKNADTGDITIRYSSPKELPFAFEWTATIKPDGYVTSTPLKFFSAERLATIKATAEQTFADMVNSHRDMAEKKADAVKAIETVLRQAGDDQDFIDLLKRPNVCYRMINGRDNINPPEKIVANIEKLRPNIEEVRAAAKGDPALAKAVVKALYNFGGKPIPAGYLAKVVAAAREVKIDKLQKMKGSSSPQEFHAAMRQFVKAVYDIMVKSRFTLAFEEFGAQDTSNLNTFVATILTTRCSASTRNAIKACLVSDGASKAKAIYGKAMAQAIHFSEWDNNMRIRISGVGGSILSACEDFAYGLADTMDEEPAYIESFDGDIDQKTSIDILHGVVDVANETPPVRAPSAAS